MYNKTLPLILQAIFKRIDDPREGVSCTAKGIRVFRSIASQNSAKQLSLGIQRARLDGMGAEYGGCETVADLVFLCLDKFKGHRFSARK
mmetsp:Transcript_48511/g.118150  ORF Transcript_48511/g.118150 Transcript_48511/m.118150 type:complete len:89 (+) Transcript_48511:663-929(+)